MLSRENLFIEVKDTIVKGLKLEPDSIQGDSRLKEGLKLDSLDMILMVQELEEKFKIDLPDDLVPADATFNQLIDALSDLLSRRESSTVPPVAAAAGS
jgi:acyl carrier protein